MLSVMDELSQKKLNYILTLEPEALRKSDREFLRARREYIPRDARAQYESILKEKNAPEPQKSSGLRAFQLLKKQAKSLGIPTPKGVTADELRVAISTIEGPQN